MYPIAGVSVLLTIISFVLVILTIFAGNKPGFMEDYHILYVSSVLSLAAGATLNFNTDRSLILQHWARTLFQT